MNEAVFSLSYAERIKKGGIFRGAGEGFRRAALTVKVIECYDTYRIKFCKIPQRGTESFLVTR